LADAAALAGQLRDAAAILPIDLRAVGVAAGDIREARDSAIEMRAVIASAVVCDTMANALILSPAAGGPGSFSAFSSTILAGDTAWLYVADDTLDSWRPYQVATSANAPPGACGVLGPQLTAADRLLTRTAISLKTAPSAALLVGIPLRVTRPLRYSLYQASDGGWYLGERDWNAVTLRFNAVQPVSGPFLSAAAGGLTLHYFDSTGVALASPVADSRAIASVRIELRGQTRNLARVLATGVASGRGADSATIDLLLRNRR
jgi:hypothetical protein